MAGGHGDQVSELEKLDLVNESKAILQLRSVSFLEKVLSLCQVEDSEETRLARAMVVVVTEPAPVVQARPASEKETLEDTRAKVGVNEDVEGSLFGFFLLSFSVLDLQL